MHKHRLFGLFIGLGLLLSACGGNAAPAQPTAQPTNHPTLQPSNLSTPEPPGAAFSARQVLAQQLGVNLDAVTVVGSEHVEWRNGCLEIVIPGVMCTQAIIPGYRIVLESSGKQYEFHTDETGGTVRLATAPAPDIKDVAVVWTGNAFGPCSEAIISRDAVAFGACHGAMMTGRLLPGMHRPEDLDYFVRTYASFEAGTPAGSVKFTGKGSTVASEAEQRMIAEWARLVTIEASGGRSGAAYGLIFAWHREGGIAGFCDDVTVYVTGDVYATSCRGGPPKELGRGRLTADQLKQVFAWVDDLRNFEIGHEGPVAPDELIIRMVFSSAGAREASDADKQAIQDFAAELLAGFSK